MVSEEFPEKDDSYQAGEEARKSLQVMGGRELELFEEQAIATGQVYEPMCGKRRLFCRQRKSLEDFTVDLYLKRVLLLLC